MIGRPNYLAAFNMGNRLSSIVTKTGDSGTTGLADGSRISKNDIRVICMGETDELNANIGLAISQLGNHELCDLLLSVQHDLFDIGAELCQPGKALISDTHIAAIETATEQLNEALPPLREFILPGGSPAVAQLHLARTVCRRVERNLVSLAEQQSSNPLTQRYVNRLSDMLFVMSRSAARATDGEEVYWRSQFSRIQPAENQ